MFDVSGNGNTGVMTSMTTSTVPVAGKSGQAFRLDGSNDEVLISSYGFDNNFVTISAWIYAEDLSTRQTVFSQANTASLPQVEVGPGNGGTNRVTIIVPGIFVADTNNNAIQANKWHHVVYTRNGAGDNHIYVDGVQMALLSSGATSFASTASQKNIGQRGNASQFFKGKIDDVRIYNRALTPIEVQQLYKL